MAIEKKIKGTALSLNYGHIKIGDFEKSMKGIGFVGTPEEFKEAHAELAKRVKEDLGYQEKKAKRLKN